MPNETKPELHPELHDASLNKLSDIMVELAWQLETIGNNIERRLLAADEPAARLQYMIEYLRLNFDVVPKKK